jgi:hypothetical protein
MRGTKPEPLALSDAERKELEVLVRRDGTPNNWRCEDESSSPLPKGRITAKSPGN